jgi:predicted Holliday junction resolvase-like endonuclease
MSGMAQSTAERQRAFKESMKEAGYVRLEAYVTREQREKFRQLGGDEWLRKKIEAAKVKLPESDGQQERP